MLAAPGSRKLQIGNLTFLEYGTVKRLEKEKKRSERGLDVRTDGAPRHKAIFITHSL